MKRTTRLSNRHILTANACLHAIGNQTPYFSLQGEERNPRIRRGDGIVCCGCMHDELVRHWPDLKELELLHLSDINGVPTHAEANGWYWLAGVMGGLGEDYHGGSGSYGKTPEKCLQIFCEHVRIQERDARELIRDIERIGKMSKEARAFFSSWIEQQKPRWKREADAAIARFGLEVTTQ